MLRILQSNKEQIRIVKVYRKVNYVVSTALSNRQLRLIDGNPWNSTELPWSIHGVPWNAMEFHGVSMEFHGMPWSSTEFHEVVMEFHGMP